MGHTELRANMDGKLTTVTQSQKAAQRVRVTSDRCIGRRIGRRALYQKSRGIPDSGGTGVTCHGDLIFLELLCSLPLLHTWCGQSEREKHNGHGKTLNERKSRLYL